MLTEELLYLLKKASWSCYLGIPQEQKWCLSHYPNQPGEQTKKSGLQEVEEVVRAGRHRRRGCGEDGCSLPMAEVTDSKSTLLRLVLQKGNPADPSQLDTTELQSLAGHPRAAPEAEKGRSQTEASRASPGIQGEQVHGAWYFSS